VLVQQQQATLELHGGGLVVLCSRLIGSLRGTAGLFQADVGAYSRFAHGRTLVHEPAEGVVGDACSVRGDLEALGHSELAQVMCLHACLAYTVAGVRTCAAYCTCPLACTYVRGVSE
jgi:hypothetical protein